MVYYMAMNHAARFAGFAVTSTSMISEPRPPGQTIRFFHVHGDADIHIPWQGGGIVNDHPPALPGIEYLVEATGGTPASATTSGGLTTYDVPIRYRIMAGVTHTSMRDDLDKNEVLDFLVAAAAAAPPPAPQAGE